MSLPCTVIGRADWWFVAACVMLLALQGCASLPESVERSATFAFTDTTDAPLARVAAASMPEAQRSLSGFRILPTGDFSLDARIALARRATRSIDAQYYQVHLSLIHIWTLPTIYSV